MKISIKDRLMCMRIMPPEANIIEQVLVKTILEKLQITDELIEEYKIVSKKDNNGKLSTEWNPEIEDKDVEFTDAEMAFLKSTVVFLDNSRKVTPHTLELCQKIQSE